MSKHVEFIEALVLKPVYVLKKDMVATKGGKRSSMLVENLDSYITDITDEKVFVNGNEYRIKRLFVQSTDSGEYAGVGWVVNSEMNYCMVCSVAFGMFTYAHHCRACGNVVCHNCSSSLVEIFEIRQIGAQRVCNQCFWGQEIVYAVQQKPVVVTKFTNTAIKPAATATSIPASSIESKIMQSVSTIPLSIEDSEKTMKLQQQAEFQKQAIARLAQGPLAKNKSVTLPLGEESTGSSVMTRQPSLRPTSTISGGAPLTANPMRAQSIAPAAPPSVASSTVAIGNASVAPVSLSRGPSINTQLPLPDSGRASMMDDSDRANAVRVHKMLSYGPMSLQSPSPGFVLKTKRSDLTKIFVNVCTHPNVPYRPEASPSSGDASGGSYDLNKSVYMLVGPPLEYQNEKDKSYCVIYDIVVHPDEVYVCSIDSTGIARNRLCNQSLELIAVHHLEALDPSYKILKISSNYKGRTESTPAGRAVKTQPIAIPSKDAFYALSQMTTHPADMEAAATTNYSCNSGGANVGGSNASPKAGAPRDSLSMSSRPSENKSPVVPTTRSSMSSMKQNNGRASFSAASAAAIMAATAQQDGTTGGSGKVSHKSSKRDSESGTSTMNYISAGENSRSSVASLDINLHAAGLLESSDSLHSNLDRALKVIVKPVASSLSAKVSSSGSTSFNGVLEDLKSFQYNFRDMVITPEAGFVISAQRANGGQQIFINVCHHSLVAMLTVKAAAEKGKTMALDRYPTSSPCPYVVGAIDNDFVCNDASIMVALASSGSSAKCIAIDLVVPSSIMMLIIQDATGDLRDRLAVEMLEAVAKLSVQFDSNFTLPLVAGGYVGKSPLIFPVINQTEEEKRLYAVSFVGKFHKQGHGVRSWKERLVQIGPDSRLKYFDLSSNYKGDFCIDDCSVTYAPNGDCAAPADVYPFKLTNFVTGGEFMYCHVSNSDLRELFSLVIVTKTRQLSIGKDLIAVPDLTMGWLKKQGHMIKNWKRRFFVLSYGVLKYYEKNGQEARGSGENELGSVDLKSATVKVMVNSEISSVGRGSSSGGAIGGGKDFRLSVVSAGGKDLLVEAESLAEKNAWFDAVKKHIIYANQYN